MFLILSIFLLSILAGRLLRRFRLSRCLNITTPLTVLALLFTFGLSIGANDETMRGFARFGLQAALLAACGIAGSIAAVLLAKRFAQRKGGAK